MTLEQRINSLSQLIATDVKLLLGQDGNLTALATTNKVNLVAAINELKSTINSLPPLSDASTTTTSTWSSSKINAAISAAVSAFAAINDTTTATTTTWSSSKINAVVNAAISALIASSPAALDTLKELADAINDDPNFATTITTALGNRVRVDAAQTLTTTQQAQACSNIGIGNPDADFVSVYTTTKTS